jgi:hypothetical protein
MRKNIINGPTAAGTLAQFLRRPLADHIIFTDNLSIGPLVPIRDGIDEFLSQRKQFLEAHGCDREYVEYIISGLNEFIEKIKASDTFTLWLAPGAHDQFLWAWLSHLFEFLKIDWSRVEIKHLFNTKPTKFPYITLGELRPEDFAKCQDFALNETYVAALHEAYDALSDNTPQKLLAVTTKAINPLPELRKGLQTYLKSYPDSKTGLTIFEKAVLKGCKDKRQKMARVAAEAMLFEGYDDHLCIGHDFFFDRIFKLSQFHSKNPLVEIFGEMPVGPEPNLTSEVQITDTGQDVLSGTKNQLDLNGIDEYIGGVHLSSQAGTARWFYENGALIYK